MNGCYAYCVLPPGISPPAPLRGIADAAVTAVPMAGVTLWVSELAARPEPALAHIRRHNEVIEAAAAQGVTPVPLRFGQWLPDAATLERHAHGRAAAWTAQLDEFAGRCEFGLRIALPPAAPARDVQSGSDPASAGRAYMERLAARQARDAARRARGDHVVAALRRELADRVLRERIDYTGGGAAGVSVAHLVDRGDEAAYRAAVSAVRAQVNAEVAITGPWPPYSFVE